MRTKAIMKILIFTVLIGISWARNVFDDTSDTGDYYIAATVDYAGNYSDVYRRPMTQEIARSIMLSNLDHYEVLTVSAKEQGAQIIVFPEFGLYAPAFPTQTDIFPFLETIPNVVANQVINPCADAFNFVNQPILTRASCIARKYGIVLALNMGDLQYDSNGDHRQYNTEVVFSETGQLIAKYHKSHLYFENEFDESHPPQPVYFDTSFGVRFGAFICFDIMFSQPQSDLMNVYGVTDFVFSSWWVNAPPLITGTQHQQAWSRRFGVNLIASSSGRSLSSSGSGIYSRGTVLQTHFNPKAPYASKLLVAKVPKISRPRMSVPPKMTANRPSLSEQQTREILRKFNATVPYSVHAFQPQPGSNDAIAVTSGSLTCFAEFAVSADQPVTGETYALIGLQGLYNGLFPAEICSLLVCTSPTTCVDTHTMQAQTKFDRFLVRGTFSPQTVVFPELAKANSQIFDREALVFDGTGAIASGVGFRGSVLLDATLWGLVWT